jgi:hypothetical protein
MHYNDRDNSVSASKNERRELNMENEFKNKFREMFGKLPEFVFETEDEEGNSYVKIDDGVVKLAKDIAASYNAMSKEEREAQKAELEADKIRKELEIEYKKLELENKKLAFENARNELEQQKIALEYKKIETELEKAKADKQATIIKAAIIAAGTITTMAIVMAGAVYCTRVGAATELLNGGIISSTTLKNALGAIKLDPKSLIFKGLSI